jgi:hypothetical protein
MMMFDVDQDVAALFYNPGDARESVFQSGTASSPGGGAGAGSREGAADSPGEHSSVGGGAGAAGAGAGAGAGGAGGSSGGALLERSGITGIFPGADIHGWRFHPCGYSCNGLMDGSYFTVHVTPEADCSYVSFGTNTKLTEYQGVVEKVLRLFKPQVGASVCGCECSGFECRV